MKEVKKQLKFTEQTKLAILSNTKKKQTFLVSIFFLKPLQSDHVEDAITLV